MAHYLRREFHSIYRTNVYIDVDGQLFTLYYL